MTKFRNVNKSTLLVIAIGLLAAIWIAVIGSIVVFQPTMAQKTMIVGAGAVTTELLFYAGAAWFGISAFKRLRDMLHLRRSR